MSYCGQVPHKGQLFLVSQAKKVLTREAGTHAWNKTEIILHVIKQ